MMIMIFWSVVAFLALVIFLKCTHRGDWTYQINAERWRHNKHPVYVERDYCGTWHTFYGAVSGKHRLSKEFREFEFAAEAGLRAYFRWQQKQARDILR